MRAALPRVLSWLVLGAVPAAAVVTMFWVAHRSGSLAADFHNEIYPEAEEILAGRNPYPDPSLPIGGNTLLWPPIVAVMVAPLTLLPAAAADWAIAVIGLACFAAGLAVVGVRDWRVYGAAFLWPSVLGEVRTGHLTLLLCLLVAIAWRRRDAYLTPAITIGLASALKFFLWPLGLWLLARRRYLQTAVAGGIAAVSLLLVAPFTGILDYARLLRSVGATFDDDSYSLFGLATQFGASGHFARAVALAVGLAVVTLAWHRTSFVLFVTAALVLSPIVWLDYFALLAIPLAVVRPTFNGAWLLPLLTWGLPSAGLGIGSPEGTGRGVAVFAVLASYIASRETLASGREERSQERGAKAVHG